MGPDVPLRETLVTPRVLVLTLGGDTLATSYGANCTAVAGRKGTLLVDPLVCPAHARLVADAVDRRGFPPVTQVVLTHHHTDHALGAAWFAARGARVAAHRACAEAMAAQHPELIAARRKDPAVAALFGDAEAFAPAATFERSLEVDLGGLRAVAMAVGPAHTRGDVAVHVPDESLLVTGDLVSAGYHFNYEDADGARLAPALMVLATFAALRVVPGHGAPGGPELIAEQARYHEEAARLVRGVAGESEAAAALRARFPGYLLEVAAWTAGPCWMRLPAA
jgi:glyoxylase-like metal-dependent hydrolase (beta-lactamase superfamily II)